MYELGEVETIITPSGVEFNLEEGQGRAIVEIGGRGAPGVEFQTVRGYLQQSETVVGWTVQPRQITVRISWSVGGRDEYWAARQELMNFLRVNQGGPLRLRHTRADGTTREIEVYPDSTPIHEAERDGWEAVTETLNFVCYDPSFYDPAENSLTFAAESMDALLFDSVAGGIVFDTVVGGIRFGDETQIGDEQSVSYGGDWSTWPVITLQGPFDTLTVTNLTTGKQIKLGQPVVTGDSRVLDLTPGQASLVNGAGESRFYELVLPETDLFGFNLRPVGQPWGENPYEGVTNGVNVLRVSGSGFTIGVTTVVITYHTHYLSVA